MTRATHFPFYPSDWLGGVAGMKPAEVGVYINIIAMIYDAGGPIKLDEARLARRMCCPLVTFRSILDALVDDEKLTISDGFVSQQRAEIELEKLGQKRLSASASAASRWQEKPNKTTSGPMRTHSERNANQNQSQNHKKDIDKSISKEKRGTRISEDWKPTEQDLQHAFKKGLSNDTTHEQAERFRDYWLSKSGAGGTKLDWAATWRTWIGNYCDRRPAQGRGQRPAPDRQEPVSRADIAIRRIKEAEGLRDGWGT
jgi:uncharacterized protein YdaU (DUF1376 family)